MTKESELSSFAKERRSISSVRLQGGGRDSRYFGAVSKKRNQRKSHHDFKTF